MLQSICVLWNELAHYCVRCGSEMDLYIARFLTAREHGGTAAPAASEGLRILCVLIDSVCMID